MWLAKLFAPLVASTTPTHRSSLTCSLRELQATFEAGDDLVGRTHALLGAARTAGANVLALELKAFQSAPSTAALESMFLTLEVTRKQLMAEGRLPTDAFAAV